MPKWLSCVPLEEELFDDLLVNWDHILRENGPGHGSEHEVDPAPMACFCIPIRPVCSTTECMQQSAVCDSPCYEATDQTELGSVGYGCTTDNQE